MAGVKGTMMIVLKEYVANAAPEEVESRLASIVHAAEA